MSYKNLLKSLFCVSSIFLCFLPFPSFSLGNFCLSQMDLLLLSQGGKSSSSSRKTEIKRLRKRLRSLERSGGALERAKDKVKDITDQLGNTLNGRVGMDGDEAAEKMALYMEGKERNWEFDNCPSSSQIAHPASSPAGRTGAGSSSVNTGKGSATPTRSATTSSGAAGSGSRRRTSPAPAPTVVSEPSYKRTSGSGPRKRDSKGDKEDAIITIVEDVPPPKEPVAKPRQAPLPKSKAKTSSSPVTGKSKAKTSSSPVTGKSKAKTSSSPVTGKSKAKTSSSPVTGKSKAKTSSSPVLGKKKAKTSSSPVTGKSKAKATIPSEMPPISKPASRPSVQPQKREYQKPAPRPSRNTEDKGPVVSKEVVIKTEPASQTDKPKKEKKEKPTEDTPNPFKDWIFAPDSSHNNRINEFFLPAFIPSVFRFVFPQAQAEEICASWQNPPLSRRFFKSNGRIRAKAFCKIYSHNPGECRELLADLRKALERVQKVDNSLQRLEDRLSSLEREQEDEEFERSISDEEETEARGLCTDCLSDIRGALAPSPWQRFGSGLSLALGLGLSVTGVREARHSRAETNKLLALQGMSAENNGINSLLGAGLGVPLIAQGLDGLSQTIDPGYICSPRFYNNPYVYNPYVYY